MDYPKFGTTYLSYACALKNSALLTLKRTMITVRTDSYNTTNFLKKNYSQTHTTPFFSVRALAAKDTGQEGHKSNRSHRLPSLLQLTFQDWSNMDGAMAINYRRARNEDLFVSVSLCVLIELTVFRPLYQQSRQNVNS